MIWAKKIKIEGPIMEKDANEDWDFFMFYEPVSLTLENYDK